MSLKLRIEIVESIIRRKFLKKNMSLEIGVKNEDLLPVAKSISGAYELAKAENIEDQAFSKSINDILLANYLGHFLSPGGKGSDAYDENSEYEYKCSVTAKFNFHMGANKGVDENIKKIDTKFQNIGKIYCAKLVDGDISEVAVMEKDVFLFHFKNFVKNNLKGGQFIWTITWDPLTALSGVKIIRKAPKVDTYSELAREIKNSIVLAKRVGLDERIFSKGEFNHILLAAKLGHSLPKDRRGPDAINNRGIGVEYKITVGDNFNFHFGSRKSPRENKSLIEKKCSGIAGAFCAVRAYSSFDEIFYIPSRKLETLLLDSLLKSTGKQLIKNFKPSQLKRLGFNYKM